MPPYFLTMSSTAVFISCFYIMDTITSDSGVKYDIVFEWESIEYCSGESKKIETYYLQKSSQSGEVKTSSVWEDRSDTDMVTEIICKHSWYQRWLWTPRFCAKCWFQEESINEKKCNHNFP